MFCSSCGTRIVNEAAAFCPKCGFQLGSSEKAGQSNPARNEKRKPRPTSEKSFYEILEIPRDAEQSVIQEAIKKQRTLWSSRVARGGSMGEHARQIVNAIGEAEKTLLDAAKREEYDKALVDVPDSYDETPANERNWLETLYAFYDQKDWEVAEKAIDRAKSKHRDDSEFWFLAAQVYLEMGKSQKAGDAAQQILLLEPENPAAYGIRGDVYLEKGQDKKALEMYNKMKALAKDSETRKVAEECIILVSANAELRNCGKSVSSLIPESFKYDKSMMERLERALAMVEGCKTRVTYLFAEAKNPSEWLEKEKGGFLQDFDALEKEVQRLIDEGNAPIRLPGFWVLIGMAGLGFLGIITAGGPDAAMSAVIGAAVFVGIAFWLFRKPRYKASKSFAGTLLRISGKIAKYM